MQDPYISRRRFLRLGAASGAFVVSGAMALPAFASAPSPIKKPHPLATSYPPDVLIDWIEKVYDLVRLERFSPPSAARAYGSVAVAAYEAIVGGAPGHLSLGNQLNGLGALPRASHSLRIHWGLSLNASMERAALAAFADRSELSRSAIADYAAQVRSELAAIVPANVVSESESHGRRVGDRVAAWLLADGYPGILGQPYTPPVGPGMWERTPPNFGAAIEPHWEQVRPMALESAEACEPPAPVAFSIDPDSSFWSQALAVYDESLRLDDHRRAVALFWRDNPDGTTGLPSGHWMLVGTVAARAHGLDLASAAEVLALLGISLADAFTSCWTEKYRRNLLRPVTYIRNHIDPSWASFVNSPAFPEYTSGHSVGSGAAAATLSALLGRTAFVDDTGAPYGRETRSYASFEEAANEAAISRLWGGIHYPMAIDVGLDQGREVSRKVLSRVRTRVGTR